MKCFINFTSLPWFGTRFWFYRRSIRICMRGVNWWKHIKCKITRSNVLNSIWMTNFVSNKSLTTSSREWEWSRAISKNLWSSICRMKIRCKEFSNYDKRLKRANLSFQKESSPSSTKSIPRLEITRTTVLSQEMTWPPWTEKKFLKCRNKCLILLLSIRENWRSFLWISSSPNSK